MREKTEGRRQGEEEAHTAGSFGGVFGWASRAARWSSKLPFAKAFRAQSSLCSRSCRHGRLDMEEALKKPELRRGTSPSEGAAAASTRIRPQGPASSSRSRPADTLLWKGWAGPDKSLISLPPAPPPAVGEPAEAEGGEAQGADQRRQAAEGQGHRQQQGAPRGPSACQAPPPNPSSPKERAQRRPLPMP